MNIALIGYGKMGRVIEEIATGRGHQIMLRISSANSADLNAGNLAGADVAIEFTRPDSALRNVLKCLDSGVSVVSGTTGWNEDLPLAWEKTEACARAFIHASNFSIGVNLFFELNKYLAALMVPHHTYRAGIAETHHTLKKDAPSGTAITLAQQIIAHNPAYNSWALGAHESAGVLPIAAHRKDPVPGTHTVSYRSAIDDIEITHTAHNRNGFALGAVLAAEYVFGKTGVFTMADVLTIHQ